MHRIARTDAYRAGEHVRVCSLFLCASQEHKPRFEFLQCARGRGFHIVHETASVQPRSLWHGRAAPAQKGQKSLRLSLYGRVTRSQPRSSLRYLQNQGFGRRDPLGTSERKEATRLSLPPAFLNARPSYPQTRTQNNQDFELAQSRDRLVGVWGP